MISLSGLVYATVYLIIAGLIVYLLIWLIDYVNIPQPFNKVAKIVLAVLAVLVCIGVLLSLVNGTPIIRP